jgi:hypothetical protein
MAEALLQSAYQVAREANIRRNEAELRALGLLGAEGDDAHVAQGCGPKRKRERVSAPRAPAEPERKSRRLARLAPDGSELPEGHADRGESADGEVDELDNNLQDAHRVTMERKIARLKALHEANATSYKNPTATYEHTWMRVKSMSEPALARRVAVIEKACGQHCIVKMRMFAEVLIIAGMPELAEQAKEALGRLQSLVHVTV